MRVLFDHSVPDRLRRSLTGHDNGRLLRAAEDAGFEVMATADKNLSHQQNLSGRLIAIVVLSINNWNVIKQNPSLAADAVDAATPGSFQAVIFPPLKAR